MVKPQLTIKRLIDYRPNQRSITFISCSCNRLAARYQLDFAHRHTICYYVDHDAGVVPSALMSKLFLQHF